MKDKIHKIQSAIDKNKKKRKSLRFSSFLGKAFYFLLVVLVLGGIALTIWLITMIGDDNNKASIIAGIVTSLLTTVLAIQGIASLVRTTQEKDFNKKTKLIANVESLISRFNEMYMSDLNLVQSTIERLHTKNNISFSFEPSLNNQKNNMKNADAVISYEDYLDLLYVRASVRFYSIKGLLNESVRDYSIKSNKMTKDELIKTRNTIGRNEVDTLFREKRIKVLNFLEEVALCYTTEVVDKSIIQTQFFHIIKSFIPTVYYLIYKDEGVDCYPCLSVLTKVIKELKI